MPELLQVLLAPRSGPARRDRTRRRAIRVTGSDRVRFLNGMVTADVASLAPGEATPALQLDRKGHVLAELDVIAQDDTIVLDIGPEREDAVYEILDRHLIADDAELIRLSDTWRAISIEGPGAHEAARAAGAAEAPGVLCYSGGGLLAEGMRILGPRPDVDSIWDALDLPDLDDEAAEVLRIEAGRADPRLDADERSFAEELDRLDAVSFDKGCYIGQEIVARIHSRGAVKRRLVRVALDAPVDPGTPLEVAGPDDKPHRVGHISSVANSPIDGPIALATVRNDAAAPGTQLIAADPGTARATQTKARVRQPRPATHP